MYFIADSPPRDRPGNSIWTPVTQSIVLETLLQQIRLGNRTTKGFTKEAWQQCVQNLDMGGVIRSPQQIKSSMHLVSPTA